MARNTNPAPEAAHVALARLQQMGRKEPCLVQQGCRGAEYGRAADLEGPRPHRPLAPRDDKRVRVPDRDGVERDSQSARRDLRPCGLVPLSLGAGPGQDGERPLFVGLHRRELASPARDLDVATDADAELPRFPAIDACGLLLTQLPVSGRTKRDVKGAARVPAVVAGPGRGAVWE